MSADTTDIGRSATTALQDAVRQLSGAERRLRRRSQGPDGLTYPQLLTLAVVADHAGQTAAEVARMAGLDPGSLTSVLDQLESLGAIERSRNPANRRAYVLSLTGHGQDVLAPALTWWQSRWDERLSEFSDEELEVAARVVSAIVNVFDSPPSYGAASRSGDGTASRTGD